MVQTSPTGTSCSAKNAAIDGPRTVPTASPFYNLSLTTSRCSSEALFFWYLFSG